MKNALFTHKCCKENKFVHYCLHMIFYLEVIIWVNFKKFQTFFVRYVVSLALQLKYQKNVVNILGIMVSPGF